MSPEDFMNMSQEEVDAVIASHKRWYRNRFLARICIFFFERAVDKGNATAFKRWSKRLVKVQPFSCPPLPSKEHVAKALDLVGLKTECVQTSDTTWEVKTYRRIDK
jgi:hypothetical protein